MDLEQIQLEFRKMCAEHGCKCTPQRLAVFAYVKNNRMHPEVNQIWEYVRRQMPSITRESVFRILNELVEFGVIQRMDKIENARFDGVSSNHGHLICDQCGAIEDFPLPAGIVYPQGDFKVRHIELRVTGLCSACSKAIENKK